MRPIFNFKFEMTDGSGSVKRQKLALNGKQIRCIFSAIICTFEKHGLKPKDHNGKIHDFVTVQLTSEDVIEPTNPTKKWGGVAYAQNGSLRVQIYESVSETISICLHEYLHLVFPEINDEWRISTLTQKLKRDVAILYSVFMYTYQHHAGYVAHRLDHMAHNQNCPEKYNDRQYDNVDDLMDLVKDFYEESVSGAIRDANFKSHVNFNR